MRAARGQENVGVAVRRILRNPAVQRTSIIRWQRANHNPSTFARLSESKDATVSYYHT